MFDLEALFCHVDDFWKAFNLEWSKHLLSFGKSSRGPEPKLSPSEMMMIVIWFHQSNFRTFKHFYFYIQQFHRKEFPSLISYSRFVYLMKGLFVPLFAFILHQKGELTGIYFIDSTSIKICHNKRIKRNKVFEDFAKIGKTTTGWFYGLKLHLIINEKGEIISFQLTQGHVADSKCLDLLSEGLSGKLFGDKGYIHQKATASLFKRGLRLFTSLRSNMKAKLMDVKDKILLRKRSIIETVNDQLKNISQIEHTRHRSKVNFMINLFSGLAAYCLQPKKPKLKLDRENMGLIAA